MLCLLRFVIGISVIRYLSVPLIVSRFVLKRRTFYSRCMYSSKLRIISFYVVTIVRTVKLK
jgi:hypothetical protein